VPCAGDAAVLQEVHVTLQELAQTQARYQELEERLRALETLAVILDALFDYCEENASVSSVPVFKEALLDQYSPVHMGEDGLELVLCMLTHVFLPKRLVRAAHLWKRKWAK
jgi:hypothetical protein